MLCLFLSSCFDSTTKITVRPDGSGTIEETVIVRRVAIEQIRNMVGEMARGLGGNQESIETHGLNLFDESKLRADATKLGDGVEYQSGQRIVNEHGEGYRAVYTFADISRLRINQNPSEKIPGAGTVKLPTQPKEFVTFEFTRGSPNRLVVYLPRQGQPDSIEAEKAQSADSSQGGVKVVDDNSVDVTFDSKSEDSVDISFGNKPKPTPDRLSRELDPQVMAMVQGLFENMRMRLVLQFQGTITETNATHLEGSRVTLFEMDFGALLENPEKLAGLYQEQLDSLEDVKGLISGLPGFKVDMNEELYIEFQ